MLLRYYGVSIGGGLGYISGYVYTVKNHTSIKKEFPLLFGIIGVLIGGTLGHLSDFLIYKTVSIFF